MVKIRKRLKIVLLISLLIGRNPSNHLNAKVLPKQNTVLVVNSLRGGSKLLKYPKNFNEQYHILLKKYFPDSKKRVEYERSQHRLFMKVTNKIYLERMYDPNKSVKEVLRSLSRKEYESIKYSRGKGFYAYKRHYRTRPNIYDNRESFLIKMHNKKYRERFLKSLEVDIFDEY